ncbi:MAG: hypothetical protein DIU80_002645 [Chloroflexota bacterium]|nr:MAG: hypothetical protein DIU80_00345 [Chloroflexota bacterium]
MSKKNANQDYYKVSGRQEKGTLPSDIAPDKQGMSRSQARVARGEAAPPHHDDSAEAQEQQERPAGGHDDRE